MMSKATDSPHQMTNNRADESHQMSKINYLDAIIRGIMWGLLFKHPEFRPRGSG